MLVKDSSETKLTNTGETKAVRKIKSLLQNKNQWINFSSVLTKVAEKEISRIWKKSTLMIE